MIEFDRDSERMEVTCDGCYTANLFYNDCEYAMFSGAREYAHSQGWKTTKDSGDWQNICPQCQIDSDFKVVK